MTRGQIVTLLTSRHEAFERRDLRKLVGLYSEECVLESPMAGTVSGRAAIEQAFQAMFTAFPDLVYTSDEILIDGDRVAQTLTLVGTDIGGVLGLPPTPQRVPNPPLGFSTLQDEHTLAGRLLYVITCVVCRCAGFRAPPHVCA